MKNCKNEVLRVYEVDMYNEQPSHFEVLKESDVEKEYALDQFYYINEDYNADEEAASWNQKYLMYSEDEFTMDAGIQVFEWNSNTDLGENEARELANTEGDYDAFCNDDNFTKSEVDHYQEIYRYWDGNNWQKTILYTTWDGLTEDYKRREDLEEYSAKEIYSENDRYNGQGVGRQDYFELVNDDNKVIYAYREVSVWQNDTDTYHIIEKEAVPEEAFAK